MMKYGCEKSFAKRNWKQLPLKIGCTLHKSEVIKAVLSAGILSVVKGRPCKN